LKDFFKNVHIVSEKQTATYSTIFGADVQISAMVGNSIKSDIVPVLNAGAAQSTCQPATNGKWEKPPNRYQTHDFSRP
jgi:hypothetical protein